MAVLIAGIVVTVVVHFPANTATAAWSSDAPPADWEHVRDRWHASNGVRVDLNTTGFVALLLSAMPIARS